MRYLGFVSLLKDHNLGKYTVMRRQSGCIDGGICEFYRYVKLQEIGLFSTLFSEV